MSLNAKPLSGRTPEQQAARDARKAAKGAGAAAATLVGDGDESAGPSKKRQRDYEAEQAGRDDLLEVDVGAPEPMSKAEARAAKKGRKAGASKTKAKGKSPDRQLHEVSEDKAESTSNSTEKPHRHQHSVWIGNIAFRTTADGLKTFLQDGMRELGWNGAGEAVTRVNLPKKPGKGEFAGNKGFAYVDFASDSLQKLAVGLSERNYDGRRLLIKLGNDHSDTPNARTPRPEKGPKLDGFIKKQPHGESSTLFVGNLGWDTTEESLRDHVETNAKGEVKLEEGEEIVEGRGGKRSGLRKVRLGAFEDTGRCKGFAFLDFLTPAFATAALSDRRNHFLGGRKLVVQYASEDATKRSGGSREKRDQAPPSKKPRREPPAAAAPESATRTDVAIAESVLAPVADKPRVHERRTGNFDKGDKGDKRGKKWEAAGRPRPGAALAMAKREKVGIVEAQGTKVVFD